MGVRNSNFDLQGRITGGTDKLTGERIQGPAYQNDNLIPRMGRGMAWLKDNAASTRDTRMVEPREHLQRANEQSLARETAAGVDPEFVRQTQRNLDRISGVPTAPVANMPNATASTWRRAVTPKAPAVPDYRNDVKAGFTKYGRVGKAAEVVNRAQAQAPMARRLLGADARVNAAMDAMQHEAATGSEISPGARNTFTEAQWERGKASTALAQPNKAVADRYERLTDPIFTGDVNTAQANVAGMVRGSSPWRDMVADKAPAGAPVINEGAGGRQVVTRAPEEDPVEQRRRMVRR